MKKQHTHETLGKEGFVSNQSQFFDQLITNDWEFYNDSHWDSTRKFEVKQILENVVGVENILNIGCGCGFQDKEMSLFKNIKSVVGIDYSKQSILQADKHYPGSNIKRYYCNILQDTMNEPKAYFDLTTSFQVIEHIEDQELFLKKCIEMTKLNGYIAIVTPNYNRLSNRIRKLLLQKPQFCDPLHFREFTIRELIRIGEANNLKVAHFFSHTIDLPFGILNKYLVKNKLNTKAGEIFKNIANVIGVVFIKLK